LKEGFLEDQHSNNRYKDSIVKLLRFEATNSDPKVLVSLDDYISTMHPDQQNIYYLCSPNREAAMASPYMEQFVKRKRNVLLLFEEIDEYVGLNLKYLDKKAVSIDSSEEDFEPLLESEDPSVNNSETPKCVEELSDSARTDLQQYIQAVLGSKVTAVKFSSERLIDSPVMITGFLSATLRKMMKMTLKGSPDAQMNLANSPVTFELNPKHNLVVSISRLKENDPELAQLIVEQLFDNACIAAGVLEEPRAMLPRINQLLAATVRKAEVLPTDNGRSSSTVADMSADEH